MISETGVLFRAGALWFRLPKNADFPDHVASRRADRFARMGAGGIAWFLSEETNMKLRKMAFAAIAIAVAVVARGPARRFRIRQNRYA